MWILIYWLRNLTCFWFAVVNVVTMKYIIILRRLIPDCFRLAQMSSGELFAIISEARTHFMEFYGDMLSYHLSLIDTIHYLGRTTIFMGWNSKYAI